MVRWPRKICISCSYSLTATQLKQRLRQGRSSKAHPTSNAVLRNFNKNEVSSDFKKASDMPIRMWPKITETWVLVAQQGPRSPTKARGPLTAPPDLRGVPIVSLGETARPSCPPARLQRPNIFLSYKPSLLDWKPFPTVTLVQTVTSQAMIFGCVVCAL